VDVVKTSLVFRTVKLRIDAEYAWASITMKNLKLTQEEDRLLITVDELVGNLVFVTAG